MQENGILIARKFQIFLGGMPPNPPSLVDANHSGQILDPPLFTEDSHNTGNFMPLKIYLAIEMSKKTIHQHMANYRGVKLNEATCR